ncbi:hydroxyisourate hydrolase [Methylobacterium oryzisoli]|uniref:hydroxyisourate hydrolase n=1 Tax=Methylobacterium oryzisoli TaxID=3385502 RepID=UPI0038926EEE
MSARTSLAALNAAPPGLFAAFAADLFAGAAWVGERAAAARPFATLAALHEGLMAAATAAAPAERRALIGGFPDVAAEAAGLTDEEAAALARSAAAYRARHGFPCLICTARHGPEAILAAVAARLAGPPEAEEAAALREIGHITRLRLLDRVEGPGAPPAAGRLSTHVLDTHAGRPAAGVALRLFALDRAGRRLLEARTTNPDGRTDAPLLHGAPLRTGRYEIEFDLGPYFRARVDAGIATLFLDTVPVRFGIDEPEGHYHVALIATPWSYTVYRGS